MGAFSIWHLLIIVVFVIAPMFAIASILKKAGFSPWWALLYVVPLGNIVGLFVFASARWPALASKSQISS